MPSVSLALAWSLPLALLGRHKREEKGKEGEEALFPTECRESLTPNSEEKQTLVFHLKFVGSFYFKNSKDQTSCF